MKQLILWFLLIIPLFCQARIRPVAIADGRPVVLAPDTSTIRPTASFGLTLPPNTVGLIYLISTYVGSKPNTTTRPFNLLAQVDRQLSFEYTGDMNTIIHNLIPSSTGAFVNAYLFPGIEEGAPVNSVSTSNYLVEYSRFHYNGGPLFVPVRSSTRSRTMMLNIENLESTQAIKVIVEAIALVDAGH